MSTFYAPAPIEGPFETGYHLNPWISLESYNATNVCRPESLPTPHKPGIKEGSSSLCSIKSQEKCCTGSKVHRGDGLMGSELSTDIFTFFLN